MKYQRATNLKLISKLVTAKDSKPAPVVHDLSEVRYLELYHPEVTRAARAAQPLIDIVNPQPKAFFAYLQMPQRSAASAKASSSRVSRKKSRSK